MMMKAACYLRVSTQAQAMTWKDANRNRIARVRRALAKRGLRLKAAGGNPGILLVDSDAWYVVDPNLRPEDVCPSILFQQGGTLLNITGQRRPSTLAEVESFLGMA